MTCLCETWPEEAVHGLLGEAPGDFDDGRVALLVCPICGDLGCRALSTTLVFRDEAVEWQDLGWQVNSEPFVPAEGGFDPPICLRFDRGLYEHLLRDLLTR